MKIAGIDFPMPILDALRDGRLVVFAGAGVSVGEPAKLPRFKELATAIAQYTGEALQKHEPEDRFLGRLQHKDVKVHTRAAERLQENCRGEPPKPTDLHRDLLRLYLKSESPRIVTTNFDLLFEQAAEDMFDLEPDVFTAPALPLGRKFNGIVHVHGDIDRPNDMVLTDADFGRAYLTEGWARRFLVELFRSFTVLFVGYRHDDTVMNYLARALPVDETKPRFVLTDDADDSRWQTLCIRPIAYPPSPDHNALYEGVHGLAEHARRGVLEWQREIKEIAQKSPSPDEEKMGLIEVALSDAKKTRFFTNAASSAEWIDWLDKRNYLDSLFEIGTGKLREQDNLLAQWLAEKFARDRADELFLLIGRHGMRLHPKFWLELGRTIGSQDDPPLDVQPLARWVSLLLAAAPAYPDKQYILLRLGKHCIKYKLMESTIEIFNALASSRLVLKPDFALFGNNPPSLIRVELASASDHFPINDLWEEGLKPNLDWLAEPLLSSIVGHLAAQHRTLYAWQAATREKDPASFRRRAIKPHEQDKHPGTVDVLIDVARDCLEWLASHQPEIAAHWCDQLAGAEAPLLRRLAVHTLSIRNDLTPNEKIDWLLARMDLHDLSAQRELLLVLQQTYPKVNQEQRSAIIKAVLAYRWPREDEDRESLTTYNHFNWLHWLHSEASNCALAKEALDDVWKRYPDFQQRKQPDLAHWTGSGCIDHQSPWTVEELLSQPAKTWAEELLSFQQTDSSGLDRHELERTVSEALNRKFEWGLDLANALVTDGNWDTDLWTVLIRVWSETELDENRGQEILQWLYRTELHQKHAHAVADFLYALVKDDGTQHTYKLLAQANEIAANLWCSLGHSEPLSDFDDRLIQSLGHAGDKVAQFWLSSLSCWRKQQDPKPDALSEDYRAALSDIVRDETEAGRLGRSVLAWNLSFLLEADEKWTRTNMLPLFTNHANVDDYQDVWDSFLHGFSLISSVAEFMEDAFLEAVSRIESDLWGENRYGMFIKVYTCILAYFADDPLRVWIRRFFDHTGEEARCHFASVLGDLLHNMDDTQQQEWWGRWLKHYWENRLQGTLKPFDDSNDGDEIGIMLSWLPYLKTVFPEAVDLAIRMPPVQLTDSTEGSGVVYLIYRDGLWQSYPVAVTKLLIHLGRIESRSWAWDGGQELIGKLLQADLTSELKQKLEELAATRGLA